MNVYTASNLGDCEEHSPPRNEAIKVAKEKAAHEMRKFYGAQVVTQQGLYAAQKYLGHSNPQVTNQYYATLVDLKEPTLMLPPSVEEQPRIEGGDQ